jgi:hypothetical protein
MIIYLFFHAQFCTVSEQLAVRKGECERTLDIPYRPVFGSSGIKAFEASLAMVLLTAKTEANVEVITFSQEYTKLDIKKDDTLDSVMKKCEDLQCSVAMDSQWRNQMTP